MNGTYALFVDFDASGEDIPYVHDARAATKARDKLTSGQGVKVCETQNDFSGIVYAGERDLPMSTAIPTVR